MDDTSTLTRRTFLKTASGVVALLVTPVSLLQSGCRSGERTSTPLLDPMRVDPGWSGPPGIARYRIEGLAKVTGQKIYARDFRACS